MLAKIVPEGQRNQVLGYLWFALAGFIVWRTTAGVTMTPDLLRSLGSVLLDTGFAVTGLITARAANKWAQNSGTGGADASSSASTVTTTSTSTGAK